MKRMVMFAAILTAVSLLFSCQVNVNSDDKDKDTDTNNSSEISFADTPSGYSVRVANRSNQRLIAFKGELQADKLLGGIPARATSFGLPKDPALFSKSEGFAMILITEDQYNKNKTNLKALDNTPFTRIFAFYNANGVNESIYEISDKLGGNCKIQIQNLTKLDVELRLNGIYGDTLGFARNQMLNTTLFVNSDDYYVFPVFIKYNAVKDEIVTVYPQATDGTAWYRQFALDETAQEMSFDVTALINGITYSTGTAWLVINNQSSGGVQLMKGGVVQRTTTGIATINNGFSRTFQIDMAKVGNKYDTSTNISGYQVGPLGRLQDIGNYSLDVDYIYTVTITGDANAGSLVVSAPVKGEKVDLTDFSTN